MKRVKKAIFFCLIFLYILIPLVNAEETLRLATTTSTYETGLLDHILPVFEAERGCRVQVISVGTGKAIELGRNGDVDILLVHAREAEEKFVKEGYGIKRYGLMYNDFIILGPSRDPAKISGLKDATEALKRIYKVRYKFVSRGDDSGTDKKEKYLWSAAGIDPGGAWYMETGQGMSSTLRVADEKNAYVLLDRGTYLFNKDKIRLYKLMEGDSDLLNPYGIIAVNPDKHPHVNYGLSMALIEWLTSSRCGKMINEYKIGNNSLFYVKNKG